MAWFSRSAPVPDPLLPPLTAQQADRLRSEALDAWTAAGFASPQVRGDHVVDGAGAVYGLGNLAASVADVPERQWRAAVRHHADMLAELARTDEPGSFDDVRHLVVARVVDAATLPEGSGPIAGPTIAPGLAVRTTLDLPTHVTMLHDATYGGWAVTGPDALANLRKLPVPEHTPLDAGGGAVVHCFFSDDFFGASRLLVLDELLAAHVGVERPVHGTLVVVPHRHLVAAHVLADASVVNAMSALVALADRGRNAPGALSAEVYYRSPDGTLQTVSRHDEDGGTQIVVDGAFAEAMTTLGLVG